jgi:hypothetical protein
MGSVFPLHDRDAQLRAVAEVARLNFFNRGAKDYNMHTFVVVPGASGIGKSRFGFEVFRRMETQFPAEGAAAAGGGGGGGSVGVDSTTIVTRYVFVDFNNGHRFETAFDQRYDDDRRMGLRLAAQGVLKCQFLDLVGKPTEELRAFRVRAVLERIVTDALKSADDDAVVAVVLHLDEFQAYVDAFGDADAGRTALKGMLRHVGDFMRTGLTGSSFERRFFVVPVLTGTAANDVGFLRTDKYQEQILLLEPLTERSALAMFDEKFPGREVVRAQDHFRIALADSGYVPRIVRFLLDGAATDTDVAETNWGARLDTLYLVNERIRRSLELSHFGGRESATAIVQFALSATPVDREFVLPGGKAVGELERKGEILLVPDSASRAFHVRLPFVQLRALNQLLAGEQSAARAPFPPELLFSPTRDRPWRWQDFELLHAHFQVLRMKALLAAQQARILAAHDRSQLAVKELAAAQGDDFVRAAADSRAWETRLTDLRQEAQEGFSLAHVCRGAVGNPSTLARRVLLRDSTRCFREEKKWIVLRKDQPRPAATVGCGAAGECELLEGVFLCAAGTALFDGRFCCASATAGRKAVLVVWQDKHTEVMNASPTVSKQFILEWHAEAHHALVHWHDGYDVVFLFLTNRPLVEEGLGDAVTLPKDLLVVTRQQLHQYLSPTFAGRGLIPLADHRSTGAHAAADDDAGCGGSDAPAPVEDEDD